jgi:endonuclease YncB( thermonuclease family)
MMYKRQLACLFLSVWLFSAACDARSALKKGPGGYVLVTKVVDGDTFYFDNGNAKGEKARLIGVDAPESRAVFKKKEGYYGKEAKTH